MNELLEKKTGSNPAQKIVEIIQVFLGAKESKDLIRKGGLAIAGRIRMTMRYAHLAPDHMNQAIRVLDSDGEVRHGEILDGHYLDTEGRTKKNQDAGVHSEHPDITRNTW